MTAPVILALDISKTCTGVAFGRVGERPTFLSIKGNDIDETAAMMKLGRWLIEWIRVSKPDHIFYEAAIDRVLSSAHTTIVLAKMVGTVEFITGMKGIAARKAHVQTVRKSFLGQGRPEDPKQHARLMCAAMEWAPNNLDEADAAAIFYWGSLQVAAKHAQYVSPMLQAKVAEQADNERFARAAAKQERRRRA